VAENSKNVVGFLHLIFLLILLVVEASKLSHIQCANCDVLVDYLSILSEYVFARFTPIYILDPDAG
jgi:hypothetical protein